MQTVAPRTVETPGTKISHEIALRTSPDDGSLLRFILLTSDSGQLINQIFPAEFELRRRGHLLINENFKRVIGFYIRDNSIHIHFTIVIIFMHTLQIA